MQQMKTYYPCSTKLIHGQDKNPKLTLGHNFSEQVA